MKRRLLFFSAVLLVGAVLCLSTVPWWLGGALRSAGRSRGLQFATYERVGYSRFALVDLDFVRGGTRIRIDRLEAETPMLWLFRHLSGRTPALKGDRWRVEFSRNTQPSSQEAPIGWIELHFLLKRIAIQLDRWAPGIDLGPGVVAVPGVVLNLSNASWHSPRFRIDELAYKSIRGRVEVDLPRKGAISVSVLMGGDQPRMQMDWTEDKFRGEANYAGQIASFEGNFASHRWLPERARLAADDWRFPGTRFKVGDRYREIRGRGVVEWQASAFIVTVSAEGEPTNAASPALSATGRAHGNLDQISIDAFEVSGPGLRSGVSAPIVFDRSGTLLSGPSRFEISADLANLGVPGILGKVDGGIAVTPVESGWPRADYHLNVAGAEALGFSLPKFEMTGKFVGPQVDLTRARLDFGSDDWVELKGGLNLQKGELTETHFEGHLHRPIVARWLPAGVDFGLATFETYLAGPYASVTHRGKAKVTDLKAPRMHPLNLSWEWHGQGKIVPSLSLKAETGQGLLQMEGSFSEKSATLRSLQIARGGTVLLDVGQPSAISWSPELKIDSLHFVAPDGSLELSGETGGNGQLRLMGKNVQSDWGRDFFEMPDTHWSVEALAFEGHWREGPMDFSLQGQLVLPISVDHLARVDLSLQGDSKGIRLERMQVLQGSIASVSASGHLPVTINPAHTPILRLEPSAAMELHAATEPDGPFWEEVAKLTGVTVEDPRVDINVTGTWNRPSGKLEVRARALRPDAKRWPTFPEITDLNIRLSADREVLLAEEATVKIDGQSLTASGRLPTGTGAWEEIAANPRALDWSKAEGRIEIPDADLGVLARRIPNYLASKGSLQANLTLSPGGLLKGGMRIKDAASRPIGSLGVIQDIQAEIGFAGKKVELKNVEARIGGQPVIMTGLVELAKGGSPRFDLVIRGQNLSVVRQAGLLVRTDLDLKVKTDDRAITRVGGIVRLRDSLFISDVRAFIPGGERSAARRPPYFSVDTPPLNDWELGVDVLGEKFMRLRTAVFNGTASAHLRLEGTLGEPRAIGEVVINDGQVLFPFANFSIDRGSIRLTQENPFEPNLAITGSVRRYDFDLQMELTGTASDPKLTFSSNPPLESQQLLLMVMAGEVPRSNFAQTDRKRLTRIGTYLGQSLFENMGGDNPGGDRLGVTTGEGISNAGKETYLIEYRLNDRWSLVGEYDEYDDYNVGLKWRALRGVFSNGK